MVRGLYEKNPVRADVVGSVDSIAQITPALLYQCHERFYKPCNMALIVCGDVEAERVLMVTDKHISASSDKTDTRMILPKERIMAYKRRVTQKMAVERPMFCIGFKDSKAPTDPYGRRKRQILTEILIGVIFSSSGELYSSLFK